MAARDARPVPSGRLPGGCTHALAGALCVGHQGGCLHETTMHVLDASHTTHHTLCHTQGGDRKGRLLREEVHRPMSDHGQGRQRSPAAAASSCLVWPHPPSHLVTFLGVFGPCDLRSHCTAAPLCTAGKPLVVTVTGLPGGQMQARYKQYAVYAKLEYRVRLLCRALPHCRTITLAAHPLNQMAALVSDCAVVCVI